MQNLSILDDFQERCYQRFGDGLFQHTTLRMLFQFYKSDLQKTSRNGRATPYRENPLQKLFFRNIMSLPFIPRDKIMEMIGQFLNDPQVNTERTGS